MTIAQVHEAARILTAEFPDSLPSRVVVFNGEGSHGVYMSVKPKTKQGQRLTLQEEWKRTRRFLIGRLGDSHEQSANLRQPVRPAGGPAA